MITRLADRRNLLILALAYAISLTMVLHQVGIDLSVLGSDWRQGEWLINADGGMIRRGLLGSALIRISDATGVGLLALAVGLPVGLLVLILGSLLAFAAREGPADRLLLILLSPGFVLFWGADPEGTLRKEVLIYAAFLPLILTAGQAQDGRLALAASVLLFAVAAVGHEMTVFFVPALMAAILLCRPRDGASWAAVCTVGLLGLLALGLALRHPMVADPAQVCDPLLAHGLSPNICAGAITWLARDMAYVRGMLDAQMQAPRAWTVVLAYAAALLPFGVALWGRVGAGRAAAIIVLAGLPFVPLWVLALDWGRWINAHVAVMVFLTLILLRQGRLTGLHTPLPRGGFLPVLAVCLLVGMYHVGGVLRPGLVPAAVTTLMGQP